MYFVSVFTCTELHIDFLAQVTYPTKKGGRIRVFLKSGRPTNLRCCVVFFELWDGVSANIVTHLLPSLNCHLDQPLQPQTFEYPTTDFIKCMFDALLEKTWTTGKMWMKSNPWIWCGSIRCGHFIRGRTATIFSVSALKKGQINCNQPFLASLPLNAKASPIRIYINLTVREPAFLFIVKLH